MKRLTFLIAIFHASTIFAQNKKEQIEILTNKVDSLKIVLSSERSSNILKLNELNSAIIRLESQLSSLTTNISNVNTELQDIKIEKDQNQKELEFKQQEINKLQLQLKLKADSLVSIKSEKLNNSKSLVSQPKVYLNYKISKIEKGQDARNLSNDEVKINLYINDKIVDNYIDYGSGEFSKEDMALYLQSDISEKTYQISILDETNIVVTRILFFDGNETQIWKRSYSINIENKWVETKCEGECK